MQPKIESKIFYSTIRTFTSWVFDNWGAFELAVNAFRKSFSTWPACLAATENRIFWKMKSVWPKFYSFDPKMVLHFHFTFKPFPGHAQKRERERAREREKERREIREPLLMTDCANHRSRSREASRQSRSRLRADRDHAKCLDLMIFFFLLGFVCVSVLRNEWYYIFVWQSRKCDQQVESVFSMVFSRTQPNTRKYFSKHFLKCNQTFSFPENSISGKWNIF